MTQLLSRTLPRALVSAGAIRANLELIKQRGKRQSIGEALIDVRADAYGHGADLVASLAKELDMFGVNRGAGAAEVFRSPSGEIGPGVIAAADVPPRMTLGLADGAFRPALTLVGEVLGVKQLRAGEGVSYGHTFVAAADTRVALVTGGYAQGLVRSLGNKLAVSIAGTRHRIVGRVAMDVCVVDVGDAAVSRGDDVVLLGDPQRNEPALAEWVEITGMPAEELVTLVGLRSRREVVA